VATNKKLWTITGSLAAAVLITAGAGLAVADDHGARDRGTTVRIPAPADSTSSDAADETTEAPSEVSASTVAPAPTTAPAPAPQKTTPTPAPQKVAPTPAPAPKPNVYQVDSADSVDSYSAPSADS